MLFGYIYIYTIYYYYIYTYIHIYIYICFSHTWEIGDLRSPISNLRSPVSSLRYPISDLLSPITDHRSPRILKNLSEAGSRRLCQESCFLSPGNRKQETGMPRILEETGNRKQDPEESLRSRNSKTIPRILFPVSCFLQTGNRNTYDLGGNRKQETGMPRILEETGNRKQETGSGRVSPKQQLEDYAKNPVCCFLFPADRKHEYL